MKNFVTFVVGIFCILHQGIFAGEMKCRGLPITLTEAQINNFKICASQVGAESAEKVAPEKLGCFSKCVMEKKELIDDAGKPHKENINKLVDSTLPEPARGDAKAKIATCLDQHGGNIDTKDANCMSYLPLAMCTREVMKDVCK